MTLEIEQLPRKRHLPRSALFSYLSETPVLTYTPGSRTQPELLGSPLGFNSTEREPPPPAAHTRRTHRRNAAAMPPLPGAA